MHRYTNRKKIIEKQPVFKSKSGDGKKVIIVRRTYTTVFVKLFSVNLEVCYIIIDLIVSYAKKKY